MGGGKDAGGAADYIYSVRDWLYEYFGMEDCR